MFDRYELEMITRALTRQVDNMEASHYVGSSDKHLAKFKAVRDKAAALAKDAK